MARKAVDALPRSWAYRSIRHGAGNDKSAILFTELMNLSPGERSMARILLCPDCRKDGVLRSPCFNYAERLVRLLLVAPFRCQACSHRFLAFSIGRDYPKHLLDRREHKRIPVRLALSFSGGRIRGTGMIRDISMGGCIIECETIVQVNDIFYLQMLLDDQDMPVEVAAMVRSVTAKRVGFKFLRSARENKRLFEFLHAHGA
jgi:hypothetical protein